MENTFEFVGKGKVIIDGEEMEAEFTFTGKLSDTEGNKITFETVEKDGSYFNINLV